MNPIEADKGNIVIISTFIKHIYLIDNNSTNQQIKTLFPDKKQEERKKKQPSLIGSPK